VAWGQRAAIKTGTSQDISFTFSSGPDGGTGYMDGDYLVQVLPVQKGPDRLELQINGKTIESDTFTPALIEVPLKGENRITGRLEGKPGQGIELNLISLSDMEKLLGPVSIKGQALVAVKARYSGDYLLKINPVDVEIEVNGKRIESSHQPYRVVQLEKQNSIRVHSARPVRLTVLQKILGDEEIPQTRGKVSFTNLNAEAFNDPDRDVVIHLNGARFRRDTHSLIIMANEKRLDISAARFTSTSDLVIPGILSEGQNYLEIEATDDQGRAIAVEGRYFAGRHRLEVAPVAWNGGRPPEGTVVELRLLSPSFFRLQRPVHDGVAVFENVPSGKVRVVGIGPHQLTAAQKVLSLTGDRKVRLTLGSPEFLKTSP
jgi:hypothetical protein